MATASLMRIFISHSSRDLPFVKQLARDLRDALGDEQAVWYDSSNLKGGTQWWREIVEELQNATVFLLVCSPEAMASPWVNDEIDMAWNRKNSPDKMRIIPLHYHDCKLRPDLKTVQVVDFRDSAGYQRSLRNLKKALGLPRQPAHAPLRTISTRPSRRTINSAGSARRLSDPPLSTPFEEDIYIPEPSPSRPPTRREAKPATMLPRTDNSSTSALSRRAPPVIKLLEQDTLQPVRFNNSFLHLLLGCMIAGVLFAALLASAALEQRLTSPTIPQGGQVYKVAVGGSYVATWTPATPLRQATPNPDPGFSWYTNPAPPFLVEYPKGWQKSNINGVNGAGSQFTSNGLYATFTASSKNTSADALIDTDLHNFKAKPGYSDTSRSYVTIDGENWRKDIAYYQSPTQQKERVEVFAINHHANAYIIELLAPDGQFDSANKQYFSHMLNNYHFLS